MPARKRGRKRLRVSKNLRASKRPQASKKQPRAKLAAFLVDMEVPLNEAIDAAHALRFIGHGLTENGYRPEGRAITSLAWATCQRLDDLQEIWERMGEGRR